MIETTSSWPLVDPNDDGIRPAGRPDECFYCKQRVGSRHCADCVMVTRRIELRVRAELPSGTHMGLWQIDEPYSWGPQETEAHRNKSSWCAGNFMFEREKDTVTWEGVDPWEELAAQGRSLCLCGLLSFEFVRIVDGTPQGHLKPMRKARVQGEGPWYRKLRPGETSKPPGTISWEEHECAWRAYAQRYGNDQSAQRIHDRGGFGFSELTELLGHEPKTWEPQ